MPDFASKERSIPAELHFGGGHKILNLFKGREWVIWGV